MNGGSIESLVITEERGTQMDVILSVSESSTQYELASGDAETMTDIPRMVDLFTGDIPEPPAVQKTDSSTEMNWDLPTQVTNAATWTEKEVLVNQGTNVTTEMVDRVTTMDLKVFCHSETQMTLPIYEHRGSDAVFDNKTLGIQVEIKPDIQHAESNTEIKTFKEQKIQANSKHKSRSVSAHPMTADKESEAKPITTNTFTSIDYNTVESMATQTHVIAFNAAATNTENASFVDSAVETSVDMQDSTTVTESVAMSSSNTQTEILSFCDAACGDADLTQPFRADVLCGGNDSFALISDSSTSTQISVAHVSIGTECSVISLACGSDTPFHDTVSTCVGTETVKRRHVGLTVHPLQKHASTSPEVKAVNSKLIGTDPIARRTVGLYVKPNSSEIGTNSDSKETQDIGTGDSYAIAVDAETSASPSCASMQTDTTGLHKITDSASNTEGIYTSLAFLVMLLASKLHG